MLLENITWILNILAFGFITYTLGAVMTSTEKARSMASVKIALSFAFMIYLCVALITFLS